MEQNEAYWITLSACSSTAGGISKPSCFPKLQHIFADIVDDGSCSPSLRQPGPDRKATGFVAAIVLVATLIAAAVIRTAGAREPDGTRLAEAVQNTGCA